MMAQFPFLDISWHCYTSAMDSEKEILKLFGNHIRMVRESKGISSSELAKRCFMDRGNYTRIETGKTNPTVITLIKISNALGISLEELIAGFKK